MGHLFSLLAPAQPHLLGLNRQGPAYPHADLLCLHYCADEELHFLNVYPLAHRPKRITPGFTELHLGQHRIELLSDLIVPLVHDFLHSGVKAQPCSNADRQ